MGQKYLDVQWTKAFDLVKHSILFRKLWIKGLSVIFLRLLLFIYMMQIANVKWNGDISSQFSLGNGVRQGGVISAILYCFYVNDLFTLLRQRGEGCWVQGTFCGIYGYSDDNFVLAPSLHALQCMIDTCEEYAEAHNLKFSTGPDPVKCKTKCLAFTTIKREFKQMMLCSNPLLPCPLQTSWQSSGKQDKWNEARSDNQASTVHQ